MGNINVNGKDYIIGFAGNVEPAVEWLEGAVCYADGQQWVINKESNNLQYQLSNVNSDASAAFDYVFGCKDFQLNTIKQGDYIEASELDNHKYNDAIEVFELFGFKPYERDSKEALRPANEIFFVSDELLFIGASDCNESAERKLTFQQLMAIGELKCLELERGKSAPKTAPELTPDLVQKPSHYQFFEGVEVIEIIASSMTREQFKGYCLGNRIKYRLRAGNKDKLEQEIAKSDKYIELYDEHKHLCRIDGDLK